MVYSLLITLREGLEAALIIAIVLGYLRRTGHRSAYRPVWLGAGLALFVSVVAGGMMQFLTMELSGAALEALEGSTMLLAVGVLTWMLFWMKRQAATIGKHLRDEVDRALSRGSTLALPALAFVAVGREGLETVLFLFGGVALALSAAWYWIGAGAGLAIAAALGYLMYAGTARIPLRVFFDITGVVLIVLAAGLLTNSLKEFHEIGVIPTLGFHVWDTYEAMPDNFGFGRFLSTILGYDSSPYLGQVVAYFGYLVSALALFFLGRGKLATSAAAPPPPSAT